MSGVPNKPPSTAARFSRHATASQRTPELTPESSELDDVRIFPSGQHRILYRPEGNGVRVLRVVHQRMDLDRVGLT